MFIISQPCSLELCLYKVKRGNFGITVQKYPHTQQHIIHKGLSGNFWLVSFKISYLCLPLFHETRTTPSCHPSGCAYRQL